MTEQVPSEQKLPLKVGDGAWTNYHGKQQYVKLIERVETPNSQSGYSFRVQTYGGGSAMRDQYDAAWFWRDPK